MHKLAMTGWLAFVPRDHQITAGMIIIISCMALYIDQSSSPSPSPSLSQCPNIQIYACIWSCSLIEALQMIDCTSCVSLSCSYFCWELSSSPLKPNKVKIITVSTITNPTHPIPSHPNPLHHRMSCASLDELTHITVTFVLISITIAFFILFFYQVHLSLGSLDHSISTSPSPSPSPSPSLHLHHHHHLHLYISITITITITISIPMRRVSSRSAQLVFAVSSTSKSALRARLQPDLREPIRPWSHAQPQTPMSNPCQTYADNRTRICGVWCVCGVCVVCVCVWCVRLC